MIVHKLSELRRICDFITAQLLGTILDATTLVVLISAMFILSPPLALDVLAIAVLMALVVLVYVGRIRAAYAALVQGEQRCQPLLVETVQGIRTVKSLVLEGVTRREWQAPQRDSIAAATRLLQLSNQPQTILAPLERAIYAGSLALGAWLVMTQAHSVNAGTLIAFTMIATRVGQPLVQLAGLLQQIQETRAAFAQIASVVDLPEEGRGQRVARPQIRGEITVEGLTSRHDGAAVPALDRVDGVELREIELAHLRRHLGVVGQDSFPFRGTIRETILAGRPDLPVGRLFEAARLAGTDEFIERLPSGYDRLIDGARATSRVASGSSSRSPVRWSPTHRCCCSTRRPARSTRTARRSSTPGCGGSARAAR